MEIKDMNPVGPDGRRATLEYMYTVRGKITLKEEFREFGEDIARGDFSNIKKLYNLPAFPSDFMQNPVSIGESIGDQKEDYVYVIEHETDWIGCDDPGAEFEKKYNKETGVLTFGCTMKIGCSAADMTSFIDYLAEDIMHLEIYEGSLYFRMIRNDIVTWITQSYCRHRGVIIPTRFVDSLENKTYPMLKAITDRDERRNAIGNILSIFDGYRECTYDQNNWTKYIQGLVDM